MIGSAFFVSVRYGVGLNGEDKTPFKDKILLQINATLSRISKRLTFS